MTPDEIKAVLELHAKWLGNEQDGAWADLRGADLSGADLRGADLRDAHLRDADLYGADLRDAHLRGAHLSGADLSGADLRDADLYGADLRDAHLRDADLRDADLYGADLRGAHLRGADLRGADLSGADLRDAHLRGADLRGAKIDSLTSAQLMRCPAEGSFTAWKACQMGVLVKLLIPEDAQRSSSTDYKCRASHVVVLEVIGGDEGFSMYDPTVIYRSGETVHCNIWNPDRWTECGGGIHFFMSREEAEDYGK